jgi:hypothetical protein
MIRSALEDADNGIRFLIGETESPMQFAPFDPFSHRGDLTALAMLVLFAAI